MDSVRGFLRTDEMVPPDARGDAGQIALRLVREQEEHTDGWFWETDRHGRLTYLSDKVALLIRTGEQKVLGTSLTELFQIDGDTPDTERTLLFHLSARTSFTDYSVRASAADDRWWSISGRPRFDDYGQFQGFSGSGSDLTEKRLAEAEITRLALFDSLTGLANRQRLRLSLDQTLAQTRQSYRSIALLLLDLDRFKAVNDTLGHQAGDALLVQVARRLQRSVGDTGLVGRLGGDEFQIVLPGENSRDRLSEMAIGIIATLSQPYFLAGSSVTIGCSIGVAIAPDDGGDAETLVRGADLALYAAKGDGRGIHRFYHEDMLAGAQGRKALEEDLRQALTQGQLSVVYQPVVCTKDTRIVGYEALVRWEHPVRGSVPPAEFIPIAEECGLIEQIGEWVLRTATADAAHWPEYVRIAVNVSPIQFANPALPAIVLRAVAASGIDPARLELEITEGVFLNESASSEQMFASLKGIGLRLVLDDFGTGYSSLGYLRKAPFNKIKIDQSFVRGVGIAGSRNAAIIQAIVTLAAALGMETTAEGVEVQDEIELIQSLGCSHIQGYVYGRPGNIEMVLEQLETGYATAGGVRTSRAPRVRTFRRVRLESGTASGEVRLRNVSTWGAMIDGIEFPNHAIGSPVQIELVKGKMFAATVCWSTGGQAGLQFAQSFIV